MTATLLADMSAQVRSYWSSLFVPELMETTLLPSLVNREYEGEILATGDNVKITSWGRATAQRKTSGSGHEYFETQKLTEEQVTVT